MTVAPGSAPSPAPRRAFLALGSNLGDRIGFLRRAVADVPDLVAVSPVYETDPVGGPDQQGPYLNMVVELRTVLTPHELLGWCVKLERDAGRERIVRWGPRTLDVDVLWVEGVTVDDPDLTVPHPRMFERPFVLAPLEHLAPDLTGADWRTRFPHLGVWLLGDLAAL